jgi:uncharacterized Fe-S center protein
MIGSFDGKSYIENQGISQDESMDTYGSVIVVEMGKVFRAMYLEREMRSREMIGVEEIENYKVDICMCLCILLAKSQSAKTTAINQNLLKKVLEICQENISALHLADLQKITKQPTNTLNNKSVLGKSILQNNNSSLV